ncbi:MAG: hypothetical protein IIZ75_05980 [Lachnospiraceae bacterium]|nr:hypothetical protein [Lachnospiraceae bacterium]
MCDGPYLKNKENVPDTGLRQEDLHEVPQVFRSRFLENPDGNLLQRDNLMQQGNLAASDVNAPQTAANNYLLRLRSTAALVRSDTRFFGDSYRMRLIKDNIERLRELQDRQVSKDTDFVFLKTLSVDIYMDLIRTCEQYLAARKKEGSKQQSPRYEKVRLLYESAKTGFKQIATMTAQDYRARLEQEDEGIRFRDFLAEDARYRDLSGEEKQELLRAELLRVCRRNHAGLHKYQVYFESVSGDRQLAGLLEQYAALRQKLLPSGKEGFQAGKTELSGILDQILRETNAVISGGAFLEKNKVRREQACRLKEQIVWEKERLSKAKFADFNTDMAVNWDVVWEGEKTVIKLSDAGKDLLDSYRRDDELEMKHNFYEKKQEGPEKEKSEPVLAGEFAGLKGKHKSEGSMATAIMAHILGVEDLFAGHKDVTLINDQSFMAGAANPQLKVPRGKTEKGYISYEKGRTLTEAIAAANKYQLNLVYSRKAIKQLTTIQIMDTICGQVNRNEDSLKVKVSVKAIEGEQYLLIESVMAVNNEYSFGTAKFKDVNKTGTHSTLRQFFDPKKKRMNLKVYDHEFADRVMNLNVDDVIQKFSADGLNPDQTDALRDRLKGVQDSLLKDKENPDSIRSKFEKYKLKPMSDEEKKKLDDTFDSFYEEQYLTESNSDTYINPALIRNYGDTEEKSGMTFGDGLWDVSSANEYVDDEILKSLKLRRERDDAVRKILREDGQNADKIPENSVHYKLVFMMDNYAALSVTPEKAAEMKVNKVTMEEILKNLNGFEPEAAVRTKLLKMDVLNGLTVLEGYMVSTMRELMENRLRELGTKQKNEQETYEEQQLTKYLGLISDSRGMLKVPKKVNADENGLEILDSKGRVIRNENFRNAENEALFPHPPCIQDVMQGGLGDCYWIASLAAVVEKDPEFIKKHMYDEGSTVVVKLYDRGTPTYIRVKKTVVSDSDGNSVYAKGCLWVQMYEKALMVSGILTKDLNDAAAKFKKLADRNQRSFSLITSRNPQVALPVITGKSSKHYYTDARGSSASYDPYDIDKDARILLRDGTISYKDGFSMYASMEEMRNTLKSATNKGLVITASTRKNYIQNIGKRLGGDESEERGFYSGHSYTVIGLETRNNIDYVRLRNPWGSGGVEHVRNPVTGIVSVRKRKDRYGTFVIDLMTFVTYFGSVVTTKI